MIYIGSDFDKHGVNLEEYHVNDFVVTINTTDMRDLVVTGDTLIMNNKGLWVKAKDLRIGDILKPNKVISRITHRFGWKYKMYKIDKDLIVDGFYVAKDA